MAWVCWPPLGAFIKPPALRVVHDLFQAAGVMGKDRTISLRGLDLFAAAFLRMLFSSWPTGAVPALLDAMSYTGNAAGYQGAGRGYGAARLPPLRASHRYRVAFEILRVFKMSGMEIDGSR